MQLSDMLNRVLDEYPSVPEPMALRALSDSVKEFCERTHAWQDTLPAVRTRPDVTQYDLDPDTSLIVVALKSVRAPDGQLIEPYAGELPRLVTRPIPAGNQVLGWVQRTPSTFELLNATTDIQSLSIEAAFAPVSGATDMEIPDDLVNEYAESLAAGAKMRLVRQPSQPWYAPDAAQLYGRDFYYCVNKAKRRVLTSLGEAELRAQMRKW